MAAPTTTHSVTVRKLSSTITSLWAKIKSTFRTIPQDVSKGANLVVNGSGTMKSNYNFSTCNYIANTDLPAGVAGCFHKAGLTFFNDEIIAVNTSRTYQLESWYRVKAASTSTVRLSLCCLDIDGKEIQANTICYGVGTLTKLTQDLKNGDTVVHLEDLSGAGWIATEAYQRGFIFWNYKNSLGYQYPPETYSRNCYSTLYENANVNVSAGTITINSAWNKGTIPAGTYVSRYGSGGTYCYVAYSAALAALTTWTKLSGIAKGFPNPGAAEGGAFRPGTAFIKVGWVNTNTSGDEWIEFGGIELREIPDSAEKIRTARKLAVSLSNTSTNTTFDGSADVTNIKTTGTLPVANGGTGATTAIGAEYNILNQVADINTTIDGDRKIALCNQTKSASNGVFRWLKLSNVWTWIKGLLSSESGVNISGNAATATTAAGYTSGGAIDTALQGKALASHSHGNISSDGKSTSEPTSTTTFLRADGTWAAPGASSFAYEHTNETNARNVPSSGNKTNHWFNSRNGDTDAASPDNPLTDYFFGNRNNTVKDVVLHADGMMGRELSSGTTSGSFNGNDAWCIKFTRLSMSGMGFCVVRVYVDRTTDADDFGYVDVVMKFHQSDWHFLAYAFCRRTQAKTFGQCRYIAANGGGNVVNGNVYIGIHVAGFNSQVNPIITCKCLAGTAKVELGNFLSELPSSAGVSAAATRFPVFVNYSGNDYAAVGSATKSVYVDATGQIVEGSGFLPGHYIWSGGNHEVYGYKIGESTTITSNGVYCMAMGTLVCTNKYTTNPQTGRDGALFMGFFYIWYYKDNGSWTGRMRIYSCNPSLSNNDTFLYQYANGNKVEFFIGFSPHSSAKTLTAKRVAGVGVSYSFAQNFTVPTSLAEAPQNQPYTDYWSIVKQPYYWQTNEGMGSAAQPVYVNENGEISSCTNRLPTVIIPKNSEWPYNLYSKLSSYNNGDVVNILNVSGENSKKVQMTSSTTADIATINNNYFRSFIKYGSRWYVEY